MYFLTSPIPDTCLCLSPGMGVLDVGNFVSLKEEAALCSSFPLSVGWNETLELSHSRQLKMKTPQGGGKSHRTEGPWVHDTVQPQYQPQSTCTSFITWEENKVFSCLKQ